VELLKVKTDILDRALGEMPSKLDTKESRVMLLTIGLQESRFTATRQLVGKPPKPTGPAKSYWQGEKGGGMVHGVRVHASTNVLAHEAYNRHKVAANDLAIWNAIEFDQVLACTLARLLLYSDPFKLPELGAQGAAWSLYTRTWKPGKPKPDTWPEFYQQALAFVKST